MSIIEPQWASLPLNLWTNIGVFALSMVCLRRVASQALRWRLREDSDTPKPRRECMTRLAMKELTSEANKNVGWDQPEIGAEILLEVSLSCDGVDSSFKSRDTIDPLEKVRRLNPFFVKSSQLGIEV